MKCPLLLVLFSGLFLLYCSAPSTETGSDAAAQSSYLDYSGSDDQFTGGINMIPVSTPAGDFRVWTKRVGNNPRMRLLLLHGGPGGTHEIFECFDGYLPKEGIEYIYYDQKVYFEGLAKFIKDVDSGAF